ncbi:dihydrofolate reductase family protein [Chelativorans salis]|uniref:Dihydrofolate reductase family protein n=1 Tax=Chelativorans salis TaxID=2978478 RepID=A0ABT2LL35_9HYPH|nr:dihydrofolate reductase family protein [Chelativorans sp. EGI FJ00035]MCT7374759.1 dihydrofolate reductase family protein [Chelativorans sp. EGI FJ00035]
MGARGKVFWHATMSLDGFIADPEDRVDWVFEYKAPNPAADEAIRTTGAVLAGRRTYDVGISKGGKVYGGRWSGPQFIITHNPPDPSHDPEFTFVSEDIGAAVSRGLAATEGKNLLLIGASVVRQCVEAGLVDEVLIHVAPILLGDGVRLFSRTGLEPVRLERTEVSEAGQITNMRFRLAKGSA